MIFKRLLNVVTIATAAYGLPLLQGRDKKSDDISAETITSESSYLFSFPNTAQNDNMFPMEQCKGVTLEEATIDQLQEYMSKGILTSVDLVTCYTQRYLQLNSYTKNIAELNPDAFKIAKLMDKERAKGKVRSPLHGIPFIVKDNFATKDKMQTCAGSASLLGSIVPRDAFVVKKLREAGAVLFGHGAMSEWADMRSSDYSEGYSALGGQSRNPYNLTVNPGGSSSGPGGAVAANMIMFALGTETDGSIVDPANRQGVVGFKPTVGLTSRDMVIPESHHQDTTGPLARTVKDAVYVLQHIYGIDKNDEFTLNQTGKTPKDGDYTKFLSNKNALKGAKFGLPWEGIWTQAKSAEIEELLETLKTLEDAGATIVNNTNFKDPYASISPDGWNWDYGGVEGWANQSEFTVVKVDFYNNIKQYLSEIKNTNITSLEDIVEFNNLYSGTEGGEPNVHPAFASGQDSLNSSLASGGIMDETYWNAVEYIHRTTREEGIDYALNYTDPESGKNIKLDALLFPTSTTVGFQQAAMAGYPLITIPVSQRKDARPFGICLMQTAFGEPKLIKYGSAIEDLLHARAKPQFLEYIAQNVPVW
ncbi:hypothetical protein HII13_005377 [Brettanomyces bruxellensis]|uniref:DEBR0S8_00298g1_1 n=1 Tax=Dekkera bruxellensis TaxID=5007 RepID=A0A7D9D0G6_DEKBR|nr:hypothetical protein HII13_005377 [Brettanomyces bruxellensis]KAF6006999.1 hypothetical protein HII12_004752 [Brettanomyces bruxellensis]VUG20377.1 DEBR0S8_00298g1_1 [Brettanomyces bruxellensis]